MKKIKSEQKLCLLCIEKHEVDIVEVMEETVYKGEVLFLMLFTNIALMRM